MTHSNGWFDRFSVKNPFAGRRPELSQDQADELRAARLRIISDFTPHTIAANTVNSIIFDFLFWRSAHRGFLLVWTLSLTVLLTTWAIRWRTARSRMAPVRASRHAIVRASLRACGFALLWATPVSFMFGDATPSQQTVLIATAGGMMAGGAMTLAPVWQASLTYAITLAAPTVAVLLASKDPMLWGLAALSASFSFVIAHIVMERARLYEQAFHANVQLRDQSQVISLLLKEFEENGSDWLFEVDRNLRLTRVAERCARMFRRRADELEGVSVLSLIGGSEDPNAAAHALAVEALSRAFRRRAAFRDLLLPISVGGESRWWLLTGRPVLGEAGVFLGYRGVGSDVTETKRAEQAIERMANYDAVTGLPNRNLMARRLDAALERCATGAAGFALISIDLDRFKQVNDTLGHQSGDQLLREVASRIRGALQEHDCVARFGGDEFVVLQADLRLSPEVAASALAQKLVSRIGAPYVIDGQRVLIGASAGVAIAPSDGDTADELMRNSDLALYRSKAEGKGRYSFFKPEMDTQMKSRRHLEIDLRDAIDNGQLRVHFQPLLETSTGRVTACEALVRWNHPTRGQVSPGEFIPIAEETGLIMALGEFVLRVACKEAASWSRDIAVGVNLSAAQFRRGDLAALVESVLEETGLPPARLDLEITESILIEDKEAVLTTLGRLRKLGVSISLDDFGTGYSSLAYLSSFPFDKIKIDRTFVQDVASRPDSAAIIRAITGLAATLGMCTTAEGVESVEELDWLRAHGCGEVQGYLFSAAVPAEEFRALVGIRSQPRPRLVDGSAAA